MILITFFAGILGGMVGIAGGTLLGPVFLSLGVLPMIAASTNQYLVMISTVSVTIQFIYMGVLNIPYTLYLGFF